MESLRFLMVSTHYPPAHLGGDARFVEYLSNELVRAGHEVHILHSPHAFALQRGFLPVLDKVTPEGVHLDTFLSPLGRVDPVLSLIFGRGPGSIHQFRELTLHLKPDVIHWHNTKGFIGRPVLSQRGFSLYTAHDYYAVCPRSSLLRPRHELCKSPFLCQSCLLRSGKPPQLWRTLNMRVLKLSDRLMVISPSEFLAERLSMDGIKVDEILRNFVPDRGVIDFTENPMRIVYIGVLERFKGLMTLLEAFNSCRDSQGFELSIFGEGTLRTELQRRIQLLGLKGRVQTHGFVPLERIKGTHLRDTAAVVVPSESYENAPLAALEAMSMGIPVIGSAIGGLPEILKPGSGSVLVPPGNSTHLAEEIVGLWNDRMVLKDRSRKARAAYELFYSPDAHLRSYMEILQRRLT